LQNECGFVCNIINTVVQSLACHLKCLGQHKNFCILGDIQSVPDRKLVILVTQDLSISIGYFQMIFIEILQLKFGKNTQNGRLCHFKTFVYMSLLLFFFLPSVANQATYPQAGYSVQPTGNNVTLYPTANNAN
jgi:hypothetical protein